jgi:hypothetical protein
VRMSELSKWSPAHMHSTVPSPPESQQAGSPSPQRPAATRQAVYETSAAITLVLLQLSAEAESKPIDSWQRLEQALATFLTLRTAVVAKGLVRHSGVELTPYGHVADIFAPFVSASDYEQLVADVAPFAKKPTTSTVTLTSPFPPCHLKTPVTMKHLPAKLRAMLTPSVTVIMNGPMAPFFDVACWCRAKKRTVAKARKAADGVLVNLRLQAKYSERNPGLGTRLCEGEAKKLGIGSSCSDTTAHGKLISDRINGSEGATPEMAFGCIVAPAHKNTGGGDGFCSLCNVTIMTQGAKERVYPLSLLLAP